MCFVPYNSHPVHPNVPPVPASCTVPNKPAEPQQILITVPPAPIELPSCLPVKCLTVEIGGQEYNIDPMFPVTLVATPSSLNTTAMGRRLDAKHLSSNDRSSSRRTRSQKNTTSSKIHPGPQQSRQMTGTTNYSFQMRSSKPVESQCNYQSSPMRM